MNSYISSLAISFHAKLTSYLPHIHENGDDPLISASEVKKKLICQNVSIPLKKGQSICRQHIFGVVFFIFPRLRDISCSRFFWQSLFVSSARTPDSPITLASGMCVLNSDSKTGGYAQTLGWESLSWNKRISDAEHPIFLPAKMRRDDIGNVDIVDAAEEGRPNDHQYEHESKKKKKNRGKNNCYWLCQKGVQMFIRGAKWRETVPHHVINHLPYGDLQSSQRLVGWQDVRQTCEAQHAGHCKQHLCDQLGVLLVPVLTHCKTTKQTGSASTAFLLQQS